MAFLAFGPSHVLGPLDWLVSVLLPGGCVATGGLLSRRVPANRTGIALAWVGAAPAAVATLESWGRTSVTDHPWPAARQVLVVETGAWVWNLAGFAALCLVFPAGRLLSRRWRLLAGGAVLVGAFANVVVSTLTRADTAGAPSRTSAPTRHVALGPAAVTAVVAAFAGVLAVLLCCVLAVVLRYRRGDPVVRAQVRWLVLGAGTVPALLAAGWLAESLGASTDVAYTGFMVAMVVAIPAAVAVAVLRYDLFDVDRLLGASLAWLLTSVLSAGLFAAVVFMVEGAVSSASGLGTTSAGFATALCLLPLHRWVNAVVGRLVDRERTVTLARVREFVRQVRDGQAEPEAAEALMRTVLGDPELRLLIHAPGSPGATYADLSGRPAVVAADAVRVPLVAAGIEAGVIVLGSSSARLLRKAREVSREARLPIEVSRLRLQLRSALDDARSSRARLAQATAAERRRLAQDLHDGAQQQIVAVGMRLRSAQRALDPDRDASGSVHADLEKAIAELADTVAELRRLAHGVRPARLEDGLAAAIRALAADSPVPVACTVDDVEASEVVATTVYFVVAEALANVLKHARAAGIAVDVARTGERLRVVVRDDGRGGAHPGYGLTSIRDRVASVGGQLSIHSPTGAGTVITVEI